MANGETIAEHRLDAQGADPLMLTGVNDQNVQELRSLFGIRVVIRGDELILSGSQSAVEQAIPVVQHIIELSKLREPFDVNDIARFADGVTIGGEDGIGSVEDMIRIALPGSRRVISPKSAGQRVYIEAITKNDIVIGIGPAGTGKTYIAQATAR